MSVSLRPCLPECLWCGTPLKSDRRLGRGLKRFCSASHATLWRNKYDPSIHAAQLKAAGVAGATRTAIANGEPVFCSVCNEAPREIKGKCRQCDYDQRFFRKWKITRAEFFKILRLQGNVCAVCNNPESVRTANGKLRKLSVDHDHTTGRVRGILCSRCNLGLGYFEDNEEWLKRAILYLRRTGEVMP